MRAVPLLSILALAATTAARAAEADELAARAKKVLETHCFRCHGEKGAVEGGLNYVLDRDQLVKRKKVVPKEPSKSRLLKRINDEEMPPSGEKRPSKLEVETLEKWIAAGAPPFEAARPKRDFITPERVSELIAADLDRTPERQRTFRRYLTFTHLYNAGVPDNELDTYRQAASKLINSLSWGKTVVALAAIDEAKTIYRVNLLDYKWTERTWMLLNFEYPYHVTHGSKAEKKITDALGGLPRPDVRGDWFVARAAVPPLYNRLLGLPATEKALQDDLRVKVAVNVSSGQVMRAGFNGSGVSRNNRLIERHESLFGVYWKSYDFAHDREQKNLFSNPLGPEARSASFSHDGGEIIFSLPNGLFGYLLVDVNGRRLDQAPVNVVSDPRRSDRKVINGLSCMSCHSRGIIPKQDQVRDAVLKNRKAFSNEVIEEVETLYLPKDRMLAVMKADSERFLKAVEKAGCRTGTTEPIAAVAVRFETDLDLEAAAGELNLRPDEMKKKIEASFYAKALGPLVVSGGTISRQKFEEGFSQLVNDLELGKAVRQNGPNVQNRPSAEWLDRVGPWTPPPDNSDLPRVVPVQPKKDDRTTIVEGLVWHWNREGHRLLEFAGSGKELPAMATSPTDGRLALDLRSGMIGVFDPNVPGKVVKLEGHTGPVSALDFSRDGKRIASVGRDKTVRVWDATSGKQLYDAKPDRLVRRVVRLSPDGKLLASGTDTIEIRDAKSGEWLRDCDLKAGDVQDLAFSPDGSLIVSAGKELRVWDASTGKAVETLRKHRGAVTAVVFSSDGKLMATGGSDKYVHLWAVKDRTFTHKAQFSNRDSVIGVRFSKDEKNLIVALSWNWIVRVLEISTSMPIGEFKANARGGLAVSHDGKSILTLGEDRSVRIWPMPQISSGPFQGHRDRITALAVSADGKMVLTGSGDSTARLWEASGKLRQRFLGHTWGITQVAFLPDGKKVLTTGDTSLRQWDVATGEQLRRWDLRHPVTGMTLSRDGKLLALYANEGMLRFMHLTTDEVREYEARKGGHSIALSPDSKVLAVAGTRDRMVTLFDATTGKEMAAPAGLDVHVASLAFSPDGKLLAVGCSDGDVRLWDVAKAKLVGRLQGHQAAVYRVVFNGKGTRLFSTSGGTIKLGNQPPSYKDCALRMWEVPSGKLLKSWEQYPGEVRQMALDGEEREALLSFGNYVYRQPLDKDRTMKEIRETPK